MKYSVVESTILSFLWPQHIFDGIVDVITMTMAVLSSLPLLRGNIHCALLIECVDLKDVRNKHFVASSIKDLCDNI